MAIQRKSFIIPLAFKDGVYRTYDLDGLITNGWSVQEALNYNCEITCRVSGFTSQSSLEITLAANAAEDLVISCLINSSGSVILQRKNGFQKNLSVRADSIPHEFVIRLVRNSSFVTVYINEQPNIWIWLRADLYPDLCQGHFSILHKSTDINSVMVKPFGFGIRWPCLVLETDQEKNWMSGQVLPGAILKCENLFYLYFIGVDQTAPGSESGGQARTGVAISSDLLNWNVLPEPVLETDRKASSYKKMSELSINDNMEYEPANDAWDGLYQFVNGAAVLPDRKIGLLYSGFDGNRWNGLGLATGISPKGPFYPHPGNPIYTLGANDAWDQYAMHEFDVYSENDLYYLFYAGYDGTGDRGGIAVSNDMLNWSRPACPCFEPQSKNWWDSIHVRPRSLTRINEFYYLLYEGCGKQKDEQGNQYFTDSIGMARSRDLSSWEYYPCNPIIAQSAQKSDYDSLWTGWPRMIVKDQYAYIFYAAAGDTSISGSLLPGIGLRIVSLDEIINWPEVEK